MVDRNIARLYYQSREANDYLLLLHDLNQERMIVPSLDRDLTDVGKEVISNAFGDTLDIERIVRIVEKLRQGSPDLSEMDAFIYEASEVIHALSPDNQKSNIDARECKMLMPRKGTYFLGGIHVLREATKAGMIIVNPEGSPNDQCYIKYN